MKVQQIISKSNSGNRMEVIGREDKTLKTLHINRKHDIWNYFVGIDKQGNKVYARIDVPD